VSETNAVTVIDKDGERHGYDADDWRKDGDGHLFVTKDGKNIAVYAPGQGDVAPLAETASIIVVIDQAGNYHHFNADNWRENGAGTHVEIMKDEERVASFPPGYLAVFKAGSAR
jgi:hypothetical protein